MMKSKISKITLVSCMMIFLIFPLSIQLLFTNSNSVYGLGTMRISAEEEQAVEYYDREWLQNNLFIGSSYWNTDENDITGDISQSTTNNYGNFIIDGDSRNSNDITSNDISGTPQMSDWTEVNNSIIKLDPEYYGIDDNGCWANHTWEDGDDNKQLTAIEWDRNITLPVDTSDYNITSAYLSTTVNATVHADDDPGDGIDVTGDSADDIHIGDFVRFYVVISDIYKINQHEIAFYQSVTLGEDGTEYDTLIDTLLTNLDEEVIIYHIASILDVDPSHQTFTFTLGVRIWAEDNFGSDRDIFDSLRIKSCDFSFTYEKIIDKLTTASWKQDGPTFSSVKYEETNNITLLDATLNFKYKISETWPTSASPNAEIRAFINENQYPVTINLDSASTDWLPGDYNVKSLISIGVDDVNLTIQLFLGDTFGLDNDITVSIDNVYLHIWYQEIGVIAPRTPPPDYTPAITALSVAIVGTTIGLLSYIFYFQFPPLVRIIKKLKRMVKKEKKLKKPIEVQGRDNFIRSKIQEKMQSLRIQPQFENALKTVPSSSPPKMGINK